MLSDFVEVEEEFEEEAEEEGEDERKEKKEPKKKVPLFKLQAKNSKNVSSETQFEFQIVNRMNSVIIPNANHFPGN